MTRRFDKRGMLVIPEVREYIEEKPKPIVLESCYCQHGHQLIHPKAKFNEYNGIVLEVRKDKDIGFVALSPIRGDRSRISMGIALAPAEIHTLKCPRCKDPLPVYAKCACGGDLTAIFLNNEGDFNEIIGICNREGCPHSEIMTNNEMFRVSGLDPGQRH